MSTVANRLLTAEEFAELPEPADGSKQELVRGVVITMPSPGMRHGLCCSRVDRKLGNFVDDHQLGWVTCNDSGFISERDPDSVRGPDVAFWSKRRLPTPAAKYPEVVPDLAVEVVSLSDTHSRLHAKVVHYLKNGVSLVWLLDPELRIVTVYRRQEHHTLAETDTLSGEDVLPGFSCRVADLFGLEHLTV